MELPAQGKLAHDHRGGYVPGSAKAGFPDASGRNLGGSLRLKAGYAEGIPRSSKRSSSSVPEAVVVALIF
jgi:hypothetical protein